MSKVFVGIDVSKEYSTVQGIDKSEKKLFYLRVAMDSAGLAEFRTTIKRCTRTWMILLWQWSPPAVIISTSFPSHARKDFVVR
jgi:hypothetical protein